MVILHSTQLEAVCRAGVFLMLRGKFEVLLKAEI